MLLGTQWYILFNVIAGAMAIPSELREAADVFRFTRLQRWQIVILPGIFPYLVTGLVTASGGARPREQRLTILPVRQTIVSVGQDGIPMPHSSWQGRGAG